MSDSKATETHRIDLERLMLGENSISGTIRMLVYIGVFALVFGTLFSLMLH